MTEEMELRICELYEHYETAREVSAIVGYSNESVRRVLKKHGIPRTHRHPKAKSSVSNNRKNIDCGRVGELYRSGASVHSIAQQFGCSDTTIYYHLDKLGLYKIGQRKEKFETLTQQIIELHKQGMSDYEIAGSLGCISRDAVRNRVRKAFGLRGKGSNSRKGGKAYAAKMRKSAIERLNEDPRIELIQYGEPSKVRCVKCRSIYNWTRESRRSKEPCPECRKRLQEAERIARERKEYERKQQYIAACEYRASVARICKECGDPFYSEHESAAYCCETCRKRARNRKAAERRIRRGGGTGTYRRRMRIEVTRLTYDRTVTLGAVFKKYKGKCCMCGCKTVRSNEYRPDRATLDHIIALGNNGTHTWDNVQLLCSDCNSNKRDLGQMRLAI